MSNNIKGKMDELFQLKQLLDSNAISETEYNAMKTAILSESASVDRSNGFEEKKSVEKVKSMYISLINLISTICIIIWFGFFLFGLYQKILHNSVADFYFKYLVYSIFYVLFVFLLQGLIGFLFKIIQSEFYIKVTAILTIVFMLLPFLYFGIFFLIALLGSKIH